MAKVHSDDIVWTTDIGLAATILVSYPLVELNTHDPSKVAFGFVKSPELDEYIQKYWDKELLVEPQAFYSELLMLRKRINQEVNN